MKHRCRASRSVKQSTDERFSRSEGPNITMTSWWGWRLKSPSSRLFTQIFLQAQIKENAKASRHWPCAGISPVTCESPAQMASNAENVTIWWRHHEDAGNALVVFLCHWNYPPTRKHRRLPSYALKLPERSHDDISHDSETGPLCMCVCVCVIYRWLVEFPGRSTGDWWNSLVLAWTHFWANSSDLEDRMWRHCNVLHFTHQ